MYVTNTLETITQEGNRFALDRESIYTIQDRIKYNKDLISKQLTFKSTNYRKQPNLHTKIFIYINALLLSYIYDTYYHILTKLISNTGKAQNTQCVHMVGQLDRIKPYTDFATRTDRVTCLNVHGLSENRIMAGAWLTPLRQLALQPFQQVVVEPPADRFTSPATTNSAFEKDVFSRQL